VAARKEQPEVIQHKRATDLRGSARGGLAEATPAELGERLGQGAAPRRCVISLSSL